MNAKKLAHIAACAVVLGTGIALLGPLRIAADAQEAAAEPLNIVTVAGKAVNIGDGGSATGALLNTPRGIAVDEAGNVYIADQNNQRIRRVSADGTIVTVAGTGTASSSGDGGPAGAARVANPFGVALDAQGNLYIAEFGGHRVRRVDHSTNIITTVAGSGTPGYGGDGYLATCTVVSETCQPVRLNNPVALAFDQAGNLYIVDQGNHAVRKVDTDGVITTVAGTGSAGVGDDDIAATDSSLNTPGGIALNGDGDLLIADQNNHRVRIVHHDTQLIGTIAGTGVPDSGGDGGDAGSATLNAPLSLAVNGTELYVAERFGHRVRKIDSDDTISTIAGTGTAGYSGDGGDPTDAEINTPHGLAIGPSGALYIDEMSNNVIRRVLGTTITTVAGQAVAPATDGAGTALLHGPLGVASATDGSLYVSEFAGQRVRRVLPAGGAAAFAGDGLAGYLDASDPSAARFNAPHGLAVNASGDVFIADSGNNVVRRVDHSNGAVTTVAGTGNTAYNGDGIPAASANLNGPFDVAARGDDLYIAERFGHRVRKVTGGAAPEPAAAGTITTFAGIGLAGGQDGPVDQARLNGPVRLAFDSSGDLFIADAFNNKVRKVSGGQVSTVASGLSTPFGLAFDAGDNLYISEFSGHRILRLSPGGDPVRIAGTGTAGFSGDGGNALASTLNTPRGLAMDQAGNIYVADIGNARVRRLNVATSVTVAPEPLNLNSHGEWVTAAVQLSSPRTAAEVDIDSVTLAALDPDGAPVAGKVVHRLAGAPYLGGPGAPGQTATLQFARSEVAAWASSGQALRVRVEGRFLGGRYFSGDTTITFALGGGVLASCGPGTQGTIGNDTFVGGSGADTYDGRPGSDTIAAASGQDCLLGAEGDDVIDGGSDGDRIDGGPGQDQLAGGSGHDLITAGDGTDTVSAGSGDDVVDLRDGAGGDVLSCGSGYDRYLRDPGDTVSGDCESELVALP